MRQLVKFCCATLILAGTLAAQPAITDVVNAGSRIASGLPNYGIAQGAIFLVTGTNLGPDPLQQAAFPLPTTDGLAGVTVQVTVGDVTANAIMVYASPTEVAAILPSNTPTGTGTVTLNNNGDSATAPITVVAAAFGIFTQDRSGSGPALAFNVVPDDGSTMPNTLTQPAQPGQTVMLNGTGLGAITSDETQSGLTDVPSTTVKLYVGTKEAAIISAGRGTCCTGLDPNFPIPQGVAGWDVIQFTVPDGITGCHVPVAVQAGDFVSNFATIAVAVGGEACKDPGGFSGSDLQNLSGTSLRIGVINLSRSSAKMSFQGMSAETKTDSGGASFFRYDLSQSQAISNPFNISAYGSCTVITSKSLPNQIPNVSLQVTALDAGSAINIKGPKGTKQMTKSVDGSGYGAQFAQAMSISGLPPGISLPGDQPFLEPGSYSADNDGGGSGDNKVSAFTATLNVPATLTWDNQDQISSVTRSDGVTVKWSGGDPNSVVMITGMSSTKVGDATLMGTFVCTEKVSAQQFTVPAIVTLSLPASSDTTGGALAVDSSVSSRFTVPELDMGYFSSTVASFKNLGYK